MKQVPTEGNETIILDVKITEEVGNNNQPIKVIHTVEYAPTEVDSTEEDGCFF